MSCPRAGRRRKLCFGRPFQAKIPRIAGARRSASQRWGMLSQLNYCSSNCAASSRACSVLGAAGQLQAEGHPMSKRPVARHSDGIPAGFDGNVKRQHASQQRLLRPVRPREFTLNQLGLPRTGSR